jgi:hypothetical protein
MPCIKYSHFRIITYLIVLCEINLEVLQQMEGHFSNFTHLFASALDLLDWTDPAVRLYVGLHMGGGIYHGKWNNKLPEHNLCIRCWTVSSSYSSYNQPSSNSCATTSLNWLWYNFHEVSYLLRKYMLNTVVSKHRRRNSPAISDSVTWKGRTHPTSPVL